METGTLPRKSAQMLARVADLMAAEIAAQVQPEVAEPRPLHQYEAPTQRVRRKETIRVRTDCKAPHEHFK